MASGASWLLCATVLVYGVLSTYQHRQSGSLALPIGSLLRVKLVGTFTGGWPNPGATGANQVWIKQTASVSAEARPPARRANK